MTLPFENDTGPVIKRLAARRHEAFRQISGATCL